MISGNAFYNTLYYRGTGSFAWEAGKKESSASKESISCKADLFELTEEEETVRKRGKQSVLDDAKAAGKESDAASPKTETESRIVVKPDGSKVLVITVRCGQSVKVKSLKISDPDDFGSEGKQEGVAQNEMQGEDLQVEDLRAENSKAENSLGENLQAGDLQMGNLWAEGL